MKRFTTFLAAAAMLGIAAAAPSKMPVERLKIAATNGDEFNNIEWREVTTSFTPKGIHTYMGYRGKTHCATASLSRTGELSGWYYSATNGAAVELQAPAGRALTPTGVRYSMPQSDVAELTEPGQVRKAISVDGTSSMLDGDPFLYQDDKIHIYRTAVAMDYANFSSTSYSKNLDRVRVLWAEIEAEFNQILGKQCGIYFQVIDDERLVMQTSDTKYLNTTSSSTIIANAVTMFDELIGAENYDYGVVIADLSDTNGKSHSAGAAYQTACRGKSTSIAVPLIAAHEAVHMFGSLHTNVNDATGMSYKSEPGDGQSLMSTASLSEWISMISLNRIRRFSVGSDMSYYIYPDRTNLIEGTNNVPSKSQYTNFVWALPSENHPPVINREKIKEEYTIPSGTLFQFTIDATDEDGDELEYTAQQIAYRKNSTATFRCMPPQSSPVVMFQPKWTYSFSSNTPWKLLDYTDVNVSGSYTFWLSVNDISPDPDNYLEHPHAVGYDMVETVVNFISGTPFKITNSKAYSYTGGQRLTLTWDVDHNVFAADSKVRILLSDDFGETYKYVLKVSAPNNGSCEVILPPDITIDRVEYGESMKKVRAGVIKIEEIGGIAYAVTETSPVVDDYNGNYYVEGGFTMSPSKITFNNLPDRYVEVQREDEIPEAANVKAYSGSTPLEVTLTETRTDNVLSRVWEATNSNGVKSAFEQIVVVTDVTPTAISEVTAPTPSATDAIYDLQGRRVATPRPTRAGLYIVNGRTTFLRP
jgi:hypothetical protein